MIGNPGPAPEKRGGRTAQQAGSGRTRPDTRAHRTEEHDAGATRPTQPETERVPNRGPRTKRGERKAQETRRKNPGSGGRPERTEWHHAVARHPTGPKQGDYRKRDPAKAEEKKVEGEAQGNCPIARLAVSAAEGT